MQQRKEENLRILQAQRQHMGITIVIIILIITLTTVMVLAVIGHIIAIGHTMGVIGSKPALYNLQKYF